MATELPVSCPSGLQLDVREMTGSEIQALMSAKPDADDGAMLLQQCIVRVSDPGPLYPTWGKGVFVIDDMTTADTTVTMLKIRIATFGPEFEFGVPCPVPTCRHPNEYTLDLERDLPIKPMDDEAIRRMVAKDPFVTNFAGKVVKWLPVTRRQRKRVQMLQKLEPDKRYALAANLRILDISDVHENDRLVWLEQLGAGKLAKLITVMDYFDGGVETSQELRCGGCGVTLQAELPLDRTLFKQPKTRWQKAGTRPDPTNIG